MNISHVGHSLAGGRRSSSGSGCSGTAPALPLGPTKLSICVCGTQRPWCYSFSSYPIPHPQ